MKTDNFRCKYESHGRCTKHGYECDNDRGLCKYFHHCSHCRNNKCNYCKVHNNEPHI